MKQVKLTVLFLAICAATYAQGIIVPSHLEEFSNESVISFYQERSGIMWFNVGGNLYRYNGMRSQLVVGPVPAAKITGDTKGRIYIPRFNCILRVDSNTLEKESLLTGQFDFKNMILQCQGDSLWIAADRSVALYAQDAVSEVIGIGESIAAMTLSSKYGLLVGTRQGSIYSIRPELKLVWRVEGSITSLYEDSRACLWASYDKSVECLGTGEKYDFPCAMRAVSEYGDGYMLAAGTKGLFDILEGGAVRQESLAANPSVPVTCLFRDRDRNVWVGTYYDGIHYLNRNYSQFSYIDGDFSLVKGIVEGRDKDELWIVTDGNGMYHCIGNNITEVSGAEDVKFQCACNYRDHIACGTFNDGVYLFDPVSECFKKVQFESGSRSVFALWVKGEDLLIGTDSGLFALNAHTESVISRRFKGLESHVYSIVEESGSGRLWVGSNGLYVSDDGENLRNFDKELDSPLGGKKCSTLGFCSDGALLISTSGAGIYEIRGGRARVFNSRNSMLPTDNITQCIEVNDSLILAGFTDGLLLLDTKSLACHVFNKSNGIRMSSMKGGCLICVDGKTIFAGGKDGIAFIDKEDVVSKSEAPDIRFDRITVNNVSSLIPESCKIRLMHNERNFTVDVTDLNYSEIPSRSFEYRLDGFDKEWQRLSEDMVISYMNLKPGRYSLRVHPAVGTDGNNLKEKTLDIRLLPPWYASAATILLWIVLASALIIWILTILYSRILLREQLHIQEQTSKERNRMFIDISHQLRSPLTMILGQMELFFSQHSERFPGRGHIESSYNNAKNMVRIISEFVDFEDSAMADEMPVTPDYRELSLTPIGIPRYKMLVVDDNQEIRLLLKSIFSEDYDVIEAADGEEGIRLAKMEQPDIVLSDVQMPVMDGITMTSLIKSDIETRHIPVILLTAHASQRHNIEGLKMGADDYITKPFSNEILKARCRNLLRNRELMKDTLKLAIGSEVGEGNKTGKFVNAVLAAIEKNLPKPDVTSICAELGMSRTNLTNKIKEATGMTPREYIEDIKLKMAANMLIEGSYNISEISDRLGFNNPKYFTTRFHLKYGCAPSKYKKK